jgi:hypothetical protein
MGQDVGRFQSDNALRNHTVVIPLIDSGNEVLTAGILLSIFFGILAFSFGIWNADVG